MHPLYMQKNFLPYLSTFQSYLCPPACPYCTLMISLLEQIKQQHPDVKVKYLAEYCFSGTYILTLLTEGYKFDQTSYSNIKFIKKVSRSQSTPFLSHTPQRCAPSFKSYPKVSITFWITSAEQDTNIIYPQQFQEKYSTLNVPNLCEATVMLHLALNGCKALPI